MNYLLLFLGSLLLVCCSATFPTSVDETLSEMGLTTSAYSALPQCEKIQIFASLGSQYVDRGHFTTRVPAWVDAAIEAIPRDLALECILSEGYDRLAGLSDEALEDDREQSLAIHALGYMLEDLGLTHLPEARAFLQEIICDSQTYYKSEIILLFNRGTEGGSSQENITEVCAGYPSD